MSNTAFLDFEIIIVIVFRGFYLRTNNIKKMSSIFVQKKNHATFTYSKIVRYECIYWLSVIF